MDIQKLFKNTLIDFLETLKKELKLSICIDKIYWDMNFDSEELSEKIYNLIKNNYDDEVEENSTIIINKSGEKFQDVEKIIRFIRGEQNIKNMGKINKAIKKFEKIFTIKQNEYYKFSLCVKIEKIKDLQDAIKEFKEILK